MGVRISFANHVYNRGADSIGSQRRLTITLHSLEQRGPTTDGGYGTCHKQEETAKREDAIATTETPMVVLGLANVEHFSDDRCTVSRS